MKSTFSKALQKLYLILLFDKIEYQAPLAQLVSALAQEAKSNFVRVRIPAELFFSQKQFFLYFSLIILGIIYFAIW